MLNLPVGQVLQGGGCFHYHVEKKKLNPGSLSCKNMSEDVPGRKSEIQNTKVVNESRFFI